MSARPSSLTSTRPVRIVVAVAMIAVQLVLTASVGAFVCGVGSARDVDRHTPAGSADRTGMVGGFVGRAVAAAESIALGRPGLELGMAVLDTGTGELSGSAGPATRDGGAHVLRSPATPSAGRSAHPGTQWVTFSSRPLAGMV